jgi:Na+-transporting NADH:ubiquinone oxidoreductase subunit C
MSKPSKLRERVFTVAFMFAVTLVSVSAVAALHLVTADTVRRNAELYLNEAVLEASGVFDQPGVDRPDGAEALAAFYARNASRLDTTGETPCYRVANPATGGTQAYVFVCNGAGLWGNIRAAVGLEEDLKAFTGVRFIAHNETPGLGARISESWFCEQFRGKTAPLSRVPEGTEDEARDEFDAITGATITSRAVEKIMNRAAAEAPARVGVSG